MVHVSGERFPLLWFGQVAVVTPPAEIDITNADLVREELLSVINEGAVLLIVDLSKTTFCDADRRMANARAWVQRSLAITMPRA